MIRATKKTPTLTGKVTSNDGNLTIVTMPSTETVKIHRFFSETEEYFKAQWAVGKAIVIEGK